MSQRPAIIFDFGNVVAHFDYARAGERFGRPLGLSGEAFLRKAREAGLVELLKVYESGGISSEEFHRRFLEITGIESGFVDFATDWGDIFWANEPVHRLIDGLKAEGYTLVLGSNTNELHGRRFLAQFADVFRGFAGIVLSYEVGAIKPDARFYDACVRAAGRPAGHCVFIDDMPENVDGALVAGLIGVRYTGIAPLLEDLRRNGVDLEGKFTA